MSAGLIYTFMAACLLIVAGIASFPYRLSYGNTAGFHGRCVLTGRILNVLLPLPSNIRATNTNAEATCVIGGGTIKLKTND